MALIHYGMRRINLKSADILFNLHYNSFIKTEQIVIFAMEKYQYIDIIDPILSHIFNRQNLI